MNYIFTAFIIAAVFHLVAWFLKEPVRMIAELFEHIGEDKGSSQE